MEWCFPCSTSFFFVASKTLPNAFQPMVVEAAGGFWGPSAVKVFTELAKSKSMLSGESVDVLLTQLYQNLGVILHRENARSIVKRRSAATRTSSTILAAAAVLQSPAAAEADPS